MKNILSIVFLLLVSVAHSQTIRIGIDRQKIDSLTLDGGILKIRIENDVLREVDLSELQIDSLDWEHLTSIPEDIDYSSSDDFSGNYNDLVGKPNALTLEDYQAMDSMTRAALPDNTIVYDPDGVVDDFIPSADKILVNDEDGNFTATDVEGVLKENRAAIDLNTLKTTNAAHTGEVTGSSALTIASGVVDSDNIVDASIDETDLDTSVNASLDLADTSMQSGDNISELTNDAGFITSETDDQTASEVPVTPTGTITATDVQNALQELSDEISQSGTQAFDWDTYVAMDSISRAALPNGTIIYSTN